MSPKARESGNVCKAAKVSKSHGVIIPSTEEQRRLPTVQMPANSDHQQLALRSVNNTSEAKSKYSPSKAGG